MEEEAHVAGEVVLRVLLQPGQSIKQQEASSNCNS
jgi:hypothetical protein